MNKIQPVKTIGLQFFNLLQGGTTAVGAFRQLVYPQDSKQNKLSNQNIAEIICNYGNPYKKKKLRPKELKLLEAYAATRAHAEAYLAAGYKVKS